MNNALGYYLNLPYTIELRNSPDEGWFVRVNELPGCMSQGDTANEAIANIQEALELWLEVALEHGDAIPEPRSDEEYSGKFVVRVPRSLHRELAETANREGISLNQYINAALALSVGGARSRQAQFTSDRLGQQLTRLESLVDRLVNSPLVTGSALSATTGHSFGVYSAPRPQPLRLHEERAPYNAVSHEQPDAGLGYEEQPATQNSPGE